MMAVALSRAMGMFGMSLLVTACANAPLEQGGSLTSYTDLEPADGMLAKSKILIHKDEVLAARTVRIVPTIFAAGAQNEGISEEQRKLVANAIDRSICFGLSDRLEVVPASQPADLTVHAVVTHMDATDEKAVAATKIASVAKSVFLPGIPVPTPRLPIGLGSLSMEAEARSPDGRPAAAMVWGQGATMLSGSARISAAGDAYELASTFGDDFSKLLVTGENPFKSLSGPPPAERIQSLAGGAPKFAACDAFGRAPGVSGLVSGVVGAPPEWTDKGSDGASTPSAETAAAQ